MNIISPNDFGSASKKLTTQWPGQLNQQPAGRQPQSPSPFAQVPTQQTPAPNTGGSNPVFARPEYTQSAVNPYQADPSLRGGWMKPTNIQDDPRYSGQSQAAIDDLVSFTKNIMNSPGRWDTDLQKRVVDRGKERISESFAGLSSQLENSLAGRGMGRSTVAAGNLNDIFTEKGRAIQNLETDIMREIANTSAQDRAMASSAGGNLANLLTNREQFDKQFRFNQDTANRQQAFSGEQFLRSMFSDDRNFSAGRDDARNQFGLQSSGMENSFNQFLANLSENKRQFNENLGWDKNKFGQTIGFEKDKWREDVNFRGAQTEFENYLKQLQLEEQFGTNDFQQMFAIMQMLGGPMFSGLEGPSGNIMSGIQGFGNPLWQQYYRNAGA